MRFITKEIHSWLDYPVAFALITMPFLLGLGETNALALTISPTIGVAALLLTIFTDHQTGLVPVLPYNVHLAVDLAVGLLFLVLPLALGFAGLDAAYYWLNGIAVVAVIGLSKPENDMASA